MQLSRIVSVKHASWWLRGHSVSAVEGFVSQSSETLLGELPLALLLVGELARGLRPGCCWEDLDFGLPVPPKPGNVWLWLLPPIRLAAHEPASLDGFEGMIPHKDSGPPRNQAPKTVSQQQPQLWSLSLKFVIVFAWEGLSLQSLLQEEKETFVSLEYHCLGHSNLTFLEKLIREKCCLLTINYRAHDTLRKKNVYSCPELFQLSVLVGLLALSLLQLYMWFWILNIFCLFLSIQYRYNGYPQWFLTVVLI